MLFLPPRGAVRRAAVPIALVLLASALPAQQELLGRLRAMVPADTENTEGLALGDVDGDGDLDILLANDGVNRLYLNSGGGYFSWVQDALPAHSEWGRTVTLGDVDGDGDLDAILGNYGQSNRFFANDGAGNFTDASSRVPIFGDLHDFTLAVALADMDDDGDVDALIGNAGQDYHLSNLRQQLAWQTAPRFGKLQTIEFYGAPAFSCVLLCSWSRARIQVPMIGLLRIDPTAFFMQLSAGTNPNGHGQVSFPMPPMPAGSTATFFGQALVSPLPGLSNLEIFQVTSL